MPQNLLKSDLDYSEYLPESPWRAKFRRKLLSWFDANARDLPWRHRRDAYAIWVSEIMLQQTQVATVEAYFKRFLDEFPEMALLAEASEEKVLRLWEGLGYYRRARQMHRAAKIMMSEYDGDFPDDVATACLLPGVGRYTAGAVLSIARDVRAPILEANSIRVLCRLLAFPGDPTSSRGQRLLWTAAEVLLPRKSVGLFNQALMELGSKICTPRMPQCEKCPVGHLCPTKTQGLQDSIPRPSKKTRYEDVDETAVVVRRRQQILLRRCGPEERWAGLWDFPRFVTSFRRTENYHQELIEKVRELTGVIVRPLKPLTTIKHGVTRYRITLECHDAKYVSAEKNYKQKRELQWVSPRNLEEIPLSTTGRKISRFLLAECSSAK